MSGRQGSRPGGRSARVQASVQAAVRELLATTDRAEITIPAVAARAGVTPSTIYRRWGDLPELLADVAVERLRPDGEPADTGDVRADLETWAEQYAEEMSSVPGRELIRDVLAATPTGAAQCCAFSRAQIETIVGRAAARQEPFPDAETVLDGVVAPILYRILFDATPSREHVRELVGRVMDGVHEV
jgi:AcrR family transcriptional regulator